MEGLALSVFKEKQGIKKDIQARWPALWECVTKEYFSFADYFFTEEILKPYPQAKEEEAYLIIALMAFSRLGHLCLVVKEGEILPPISEIVSDEQDRKILGEKISKGAFLFSLPLFREEKSLLSFSSLPLCRKGNAFYLQRNWAFETTFLFHIERLRKKIPFSRENFPFPLSCLLNGEQKEAIYKALENTLSVIKGGPGTGKTYTASHLVEAFLHSADPIKKASLRIALVAPTGKAAANLKDNFAKKEACEGNFSFSTLHALLRIYAPEDFGKKGGFVECDLVIVDECSMIDARLFVHFLSCIKEGTQVVLIGDSDQLPPVEEGSLFADLVESAEKNSLVPLTHLRQCLRSDQEEILSLAQLINEGNAPRVLEEIYGKKHNAVRHVDLGMDQDKPSSFYEILWKHVKEDFFFLMEEAVNFVDVVKKLESFRILSCMRKGFFGVDAMNQFIANRMQKESSIERKQMIPILLTHTDYTADLSNGEVGILIGDLRNPKDLRSFHKESFAIFPDKKKESSFKSVPAAFLPSFEYAYCLSVHKSQGSEYDKVLLIIPPGSQFFGKEILYTAVTRARKVIEIEGDKETIQQAVERASRKISGLHGIPVVSS